MKTLHTLLFALLIAYAGSSLAYHGGHYRGGYHGHNNPFRVVFIHGSYPLHFYDDDMPYAYPYPYYWYGYPGYYGYHFRHPVNYYGYYGRPYHHRTYPRHYNRRK